MSVKSDRALLEGVDERPSSKTRCRERIGRGLNSQEGEEIGDVPGELGHGSKDQEVLNDVSSRLEG